MLPSTVHNLFPPMTFSKWQMSIVSYNSQSQAIVAIFELLPLYSILLFAHRIFSRSFDDSICYVDVEHYLALRVVAMFFE